MNRILGLFCLVLFLGISSCSPSNKTIEVKEKEEYSLNDSLKEPYLFFKNRESFTGSVLFTVCFEKDEAYLEKLQRLASKKDLVYMLNDSCGYPFKVFLLRELMQKDTILGNKYLQLYSSDTTKVMHHTGCLGIPFYRTMADECKLVSGKYYLDLFTDSIKKR